MDFIIKLLESDRYNMIMIIIDWLTKYIYMIVIIETINTKHITNILLRYVFTNHRTPNKIISNQDKLFTSNIW